MFIIGQIGDNKTMTKNKHKQDDKDINILHCIVSFIVGINTTLILLFIYQLLRLYPNCI